MLKFTDNLYAVRFLRLFTTKWEKTNAYKHGIIDSDGNRIKDKLDSNDTKYYNLFHRLVYSIRRLLQKVPFVGKNILTNYAAALLMIKENFGCESDEEFIDILYEYLDLKKEGIEINQLKESLLSLNEHASDSSLEISESYTVSADGLDLTVYGIPHILKEGTEITIIEKIDDLSLFNHDVYLAEYKSHRFHVIPENVVTSTVSTTAVGNVDQPIVHKNKEDEEDLDDDDKKVYKKRKLSYKKIKEQLDYKDSAPENNTFYDPESGIDVERDYNDINFELDTYDVSMNAALNMLWSEYDKRKFEWPDRKIPDVYMKRLVDKIAINFSMINPKDLYRDFIEELEVEEDEDWTPEDIRDEMDDEYEDDDDDDELDESVKTLDLHDYDYEGIPTKKLQFLTNFTDEISLKMLKKYTEALKELNNVLQSELKASKYNKLPKTLEYYADQLIRQKSQKLDPKKLARLYRLKLEEYDIDESDFINEEQTNLSYSKLKEQLKK